MTDRRVWDREVLSHWNQVSKKLAATGYKPWVTMLYGSQNYGLESEDSDVDTKTMALPTLSVLAKSGKPLTTEYVMEDGSLDNCKDLREMFQNYLKGNINFVETLYTPYFCVDEYLKTEYNALRLMRDRIANARPVKLVHMAGGMAEQKYVAFDKQFEGKKDVLAKYGYDPKQLHHQQRLFYFIKHYLEHMDFHQALLCCNRSCNYERYTTLMNLKLQPMPYEKADSHRQWLRMTISEMVDSASRILPEDNGYDVAEYQLNHLAEEVMKKFLRAELTD